MAIDMNTIKNLKPAQKAMLLAGIALLMVGAYWYSFYRTQASTARTLRADLETKQRKLSENEAIARNLPRFKAELEKLTSRLSEIVRELPNSREIPNLLETISGLGAVNGLEVVFIKPNNDVNKGFYAEVPIQVKVRGGYHELGMYLDAISRLDRIINISDLAIGSPTEDAASGKVTLEVGALATTYRYIEKGGQ